MRNSLLTLASKTAPFHQCALRATLAALIVLCPAAFAQQPAAPALAAPSADPPLSQGVPQATTSLPTRDPASPYRITGIVLDSVTKSPVPNATVTAQPMTTARPGGASRRRMQSNADPATTGPDGRFELPIASAGGWALTAAARGFRPQALDEHSGYSTAVILTDSAPRLDVTFSIAPDCAIQGFILDEAGEPVRGANVAALFLPPPGPANQRRHPLPRGQQITDDRGFYRFTGLAAGSYQVRVSAVPWYAPGSSNNAYTLAVSEGAADSAPASSGPDPLDVVYPTLWFPGTTDSFAATPITLRRGETQEANLRLLPIPGSHLRIPASPTDPADTGPSNAAARSGPSFTYLTRLLPDGSEDPAPAPARTGGRGDTDISGLSPGTYLVHQQSPGSSAPSLSTIQVGAGSARTLDLNEAVPAPNVTIQVDPAADLDSLQISFRNLDTDHTLYAQRFQDVGRRSLRRRGQRPEDPAAAPSAPPPANPRPDRAVSLPPGKYEVFLNGIGDLHLASIEATGATATGRIVSIESGTPRLFLHTASGLGTVTGIVNFHGQPDPGAMVLLIPATLGNSAGLDLPSRDQSNSDGSFEMSGLLPGGYILVAIDHGWDVNWSDASTLRRFLLRGIPLDIKPGSDLKRTIDAQSP